MTDICSLCIHNEVCKVQKKFYKVQAMCKKADNKYDDIYIDFHCKHYYEMSDVKEIKEQNNE